MSWHTPNHANNQFSDCDCHLDRTWTMAGPGHGVGPGVDGPFVFSASFRWHYNSIQLCIPLTYIFNVYFFDFFLFYCLSYGVLKTWLFRTGRHEDKEEIEWVMGLAQTQDMDKDMDRTVGGVGWGGGTWGGVGGAGGAGPFSFFTLFRLHDHVIQLATSVKMLGCCSIHLLGCFYDNILFPTCWFAFSLDHVLLTKLII